MHPLIILIAAFHIVCLVVCAEVAVTRLHRLQPGTPLSDLRAQVRGGPQGGRRARAVGGR
jgi:hypothetical protein